MIRWMNRIISRPTRIGTVEGYALWAPNYPPTAHNPLMELEQRTMLAMLPNFEGRSALDLACGSGRYLKIVRERGASLVVGLDLSPPMLARARSISHNLAQGDLLSLCFHPGRFDVITCALAVGHVKDLRRAVSEISRVLAPGGIVVYSDFHPKGSELGWERTFRADNGRLYEVPHFTHSYSDHVEACVSAHLHIDEVREPCIDFYSKWRGCPAILAIRAVRAS